MVSQLEGILFVATPHLWHVERDWASTTPGPRPARGATPQPHCLYSGCDPDPSEGQQGMLAPAHSAQSDTTDSVR